MRKQRVCVLFVVLIVIGAMPLASVWGTESSTSTPDAVIQKLGRGMSNALTGIFELPYNIEAGYRKDNPVGSVCVGLLKGTCLAVARTAVGIIEVGTFWLPVPANYGPIMYDPLYFKSAD